MKLDGEREEREQGVCRRGWVRWQWQALDPIPFSAASQTALPLGYNAPIFGMVVPQEVVVGKDMIGLFIYEIIIIKKQNGSV